MHRDKRCAFQRTKNWTASIRVLRSRQTKHLRNRQRNKICASCNWRQMKTDDVLKVSVSFYTLRSDRKILGRILRRKKTFEVTVLAYRNFLLGWRSPAAPIDKSSERGALVSYRIGCSSCSLNNMPLVPKKIHLPWLRRHFVGLPRSPCEVVATFHGFVRAVVFLPALTTVCVSSLSICTAFEMFMLCVPGMMLCVTMILGFLTEVSF